MGEEERGPDSADGHVGDGADEEDDAPRDDVRADEAAADGSKHAGEQACQQERVVGDGYTLTRTEAATAFLVEHGFDESFGARPLKRAIQRYIEDPLSDKILMGEFTPGDNIKIDADPDGKNLTFNTLSGTTA